MGKRKIFLFDDNQRNYRRSKGFCYVDDGLYDDVLVHIEQVSPELDFDNLLKDADCILTHVSLSDYIDGRYVDAEKESKSAILSYVSRCGVPYVSFSDGDTCTTFSGSTFIATINKELMYSHFEDLLISYRKKGTIDLRILAYGANPEKELIRGNIASISEILASYSGEFSDTVIDEVCGEDLFSIVELSNPALGISYDELIQKLENKEVSIESFIDILNKISSSFNMYGKNIYPWSGLL